MFFAQYRAARRARRAYTLAHLESMMAENRSRTLALKRILHGPCLASKRMEEVFKQIKVEREEV